MRKFFDYWRKTTYQLRVNLSFPQQQSLILSLSLNWQVWLPNIGQETGWVHDFAMEEFQILEWGHRRNNSLPWPDGNTDVH